MGYVLAHQYVIGVLGFAPAQQVGHQRGTGASPEATFAVDRFDEVRRYFGVVAGERFCNGKWMFFYYYFYMAEFEVYLYRHLVSLYSKD